MTRTCVLIHGAHLQAVGLEEIIWGDPSVPGRMGRHAKGLLVADELKADLIYWGTGASEKDGMKEAEYFFRYAVARANLLPIYSGMDAYEIESILKPRSFLDTETQNTVQEITRAGEVCQARGISHLVLVSSPTHIVRCLRDALVLKAVGKLPGIEVSVRASETCFANSTPGDVAVIEPQHRGDMPMVPYHRTVRGIFQFLRDPKAAFAFNDAWQRLIEEHAERLRV